MDREHFYETHVSGLNSFGIQMLLFQKENRKEKGKTKEKIEKGPGHHFSPVSEAAPAHFRTQTGTPSFLSLSLTSR
jgi:hypothetical protein